MTAETAEKLQKVQKYSASLRNLFLFLFVLGALAWLIQTILILSGTPPSDATVLIGNTEYSGDSISGAIRALPLFISAEGLSTRLVASGCVSFNALIVGTIVIVIAWIMDVGRELREEQDLVV